ncbi:vancomycin high temperature exclusion protein [Vibrio sp. CAIM 722]|uniref:Vancomycin high temperature exclusion protein n=2 Tax=Vibrio eleionomae TaxID=2653505 RepID=A0A7X4RV19_9VIBR|nr:ElyC/SanA/YdcF family protein [Vibrio eleionomae]MZI93684.1 vancomycin high temperature exclusion protein [Vibrio eleionomae]
MGTKKSSDITHSTRSTSRWKRLLIWIRRTVMYGILAIMAGVICLIAIDRWISWQTQKNIIYDIDKVEHYQVAVVLGTSKYLGHTLNDYYIHRINAAIKLFKQGKVADFLLSGDNAHRSYNEPWTMKRDLLKAGVPESSIYLDYAGFRTLDSIVRAKRIFDSNNFLIITQGFHCERALYIARFHDINAHCLAVAGPTHYSGYTVRLREVLARTKAFFDLYVLDTQPKFLGPKHPIQPDEDPSSSDESTQLAEDSTTSQ